jgi:hypothetical protein
MVGDEHSDSAARLRWWFDHLRPGVELAPEAADHLDEVVEMDWWLQGMAIAQRHEVAPPKSTTGRRRGQRRFTSTPIGCSGADSALREDLIVQLQATFHYLGAELALDDRTASALVRVVERSLWLQATRELALSRPA